MRNVMCRGILGVLLALAGAQAMAATVPYLTDAEEDALCAFHVAQEDYYRDHGMFAEISALTAGEQPYLDPAWSEQLGRYAIDYLEVYGPSEDYFGFFLFLQARPDTDGVPFLQLSKTIVTGLDGMVNDNWFRSFYSGDVLACSHRGIYPARNAIRVMDDLLSACDALWMYWKAVGTLPPALDDIELQRSSYLRNFPAYGRNGYEYAFSTDGVDFSIAAWPTSPRGPGLPSFYCDQTGVLRASNGPGAGPGSPPVSEGLPKHLVTVGAGVRNERSVLEQLCAIYRAQEAYFAETGHYTNSFADIEGPNPPYLNRDMGIPLFGFNFNLGGSATCFANAVEYGVTAYRGFYMDMAGTVRASPGRDAGVTSPVLGQVCEIDESFQARGVSLPGPARVDSNGDYRVGLSELLALIQFFNVGQYHCREGAEAYAAGPGVQDCATLEFDADTSWSLDLAELLRGIQIFNGGAYFPCPGGEDGLCVPASPVF